MSTLGEDQLGSTVLTEFEGSTVESDVLLAGDLGQDTDQSDTKTSCVLATEVDMETDA